MENNLPPGVMRENLVAKRYSLVSAPICHLKAKKIGRRGQCSLASQADWRRRALMTWQAKRYKIFFIEKSLYTEMSPAHGA